MRPFEKPATVSATPIASGRVRAAGKFFELDGRKWYLKGLTYGPFAPNEARLFLPELQQIQADFAQMRDLGANCVRVYHRPPTWFLDVALQHDLRVFVDVPWEKHRCFFEDWSARQAAVDEVRRTARELGTHPGLFAISVANEFPSDIVRFSGRRRVARFVDELIDTVKQEAPDCLATFANFPSTEFLRPSGGDFVCFNVYLESRLALSGYLDRLQHMAGSRPLILGEFGTDSLRHGEDGQTLALQQHVETVFGHGLAGSLVFSFTDDWFTGGHQIQDWAFGITRRDRSAKPAAHALRDAWAQAPRTSDAAMPRVSVVVCSYNGAATLRECLTSLTQLEYPDYEIILVDDGSTDDTRGIAADFPFVQYVHQENRGLSVARNFGAQAADGQIVAYTDSDCVADRDWLYYLVDAMRRQGVKAIGGPNLPPPHDSWTARCVAASPGGPSHVMLDDRMAEHVPGCNMAFDRATLLSIGGFDPQFTQAGDDVDICWRLLDRDINIGYAAAAMVWHHRRSTVKAFLKQQHGYGHSEAMLLVKHRRRFNLLGNSLWRGVIYGEGAVGLPTAKPLIFHGRQGTGLFQTVYARREYSAWSYFTLLEWHALALLLVGASALMPALAAVAAAMWVLTAVAAARAVREAPFPSTAPWHCRPLVFLLHLLQPVVRSAARYRHRLASRRLPEAAWTINAERAALKGINGHTRDSYWTSDRGRGRENLLDTLEIQAAQMGWNGIFDEEWAPWDALLFGDRWHSLSIRTATEELGGGNRFTRIRCHAHPTSFTITLAVAAAAGLVLSLISTQIIAISVATVGFALVLGLRWLSRRRCFTAVSVLLSRAGRRAGLEPVPLSPPSSAKPVAGEMDLDVADSVVDSAA